MTELRVAQDSLSGEGVFSGGRFPPNGCEQEPRVPVSSFFAQTLVLLTVKSGLHVRVRPGVSAVFVTLVGRPGQRTIIKGLRVPCPVTAAPWGPATNVALWCGRNSYKVHFPLGRTAELPGRKISFHFTEHLVLCQGVVGSSVRSGLGCTLQSQGTGGKGPPVALGLTVRFTKGSGPGASSPASLEIPGD